MQDVKGSTRTSQESYASYLVIVNFSSTVTCPQYTKVMSIIATLICMNKFGYQICYHTAGFVCKVLILQNLQGSEELLILIQENILLHLPVYMYHGLFQQIVLRIVNSSSVYL